MLLIALGACGSGHRSSPTLLPDTPSGASLPRLSALPASSHHAALVGPGWLELAPEQCDASVAATAIAGGGISLDGATGLAYAVYGIDGFDGDCLPTSVDVTAAHLTGEYWVAFSSFYTGGWRHTGPFTGTAAVEIPLVDEESNPEAYVSAAGSHYFAVLAPAGSSLEVVALRLGLHGGRAAPAPITALAASGNSSLVMLEWDHSLDFDCPDVTGYLIQRANLHSGGFTTLNPAPLRQPHWLDPTVAPGATYRYRVATQDVSGNLSPWVEVFGSTDVTGVLNPVAALALPAGRLSGPLDVVFDMSGSIDPEGEEFTEYRVFFTGGPEEVFGADPRPVIRLQPGCYQVGITVHVGARWSRMAQYWLKVYPRWEPAPVVVRASDPAQGMAALNQIGLAYAPTSGITLSGYDASRESIVFGRGALGEDLQMLTHPVYEPVDCLTKPVLQGGWAWIAAISGSTAYVYAFDGTVIEASPVLAVSWERLALAASPDSLWLVHVSHVGADYLLKVLRLRTGDGAIDTFTLSGPLGELRAVDAEFNASNGTVEIAYADEDSVEYINWDPATDDIVDTAMLSDSVATALDLEVSPLNGQPAVLWFSASRWRYTERGSGGLWPAAELVDDSAANYAPGELAFSDTGAYCFFATAPGRARLHRFDADSSAWAVRNTVTYAIDSAYDLGLAAIAGGESLLVADRAVTNEITVADLRADGTDVVSTALVPTEGQGRWLCAAAGTDGLHAAWATRGTNRLRHYISADGASWTDAGNIGAIRPFDLGGNARGEVYLTLCGPPQHSLHRWDGAWVEQTTRDGDPDHFPILSNSLANPNIVWGAYDAAANELFSQVGNQLDGFWTYHPTPSVEPLWCGAAAGDDLYADYVCLANGTSPLTAGLYLTNNLTADCSTLLLGYSEFDYNGNHFTRGRTMAASSYNQKVSHTVFRVVWVASGSGPAPLRHVPALSQTGGSVDVPLTAHPLPLVAPDYRRTVSSANAWGCTALGLICALPGNAYRFEWSAFGEWQELELPDELDYLSMPDLVVGLDGRWHIIYKHWLTDTIMCWSTVE